MLSFQGQPAPLGTQYQGQGVPMAPAAGQWQSDADIGIREQVRNQIFTVFSNRKGGGQSARLPDFVKRLEDALYKNARSKEEYLDATTLEGRLQEVAKRFVKDQAGQAKQVQGQSQQQQPNPAALAQRPGYPMQGQVAPGMVPQYQHMPQAGPGPANNFVPTPGMSVGMEVMQRSSAMQNSSGMPSSSGMQGPGTDMGGANPMQHPPAMDMRGMQVPMNNMFNPASSNQINGSTVMSNGVPVMIKGATQGPMQHYSGQNTVPTSSMGSMGMPGSMNGGPIPAMGVPQGPSPVPTSVGGFVPVSSTGMAPMPGSSMVPVSTNGMVPVSNGMMGPGHAGVNPGMMGGSMPVHSQQPQVGNMVPMNNGGQPVYPGAHAGASAQTLQPPAPHAPGGLNDDQTQVTKKQRWLLFLRHCAKCRQNEQECSLKAQCKFGKQLWHHILHCAHPQCEFPRCGNSKELLKHHQKCQDASCQICVPVKEYVKRTRAAQQAAQAANGQVPGGPMGMPMPPHQNVPMPMPMPAGGMPGMGMGMVPNPGMPQYPPQAPPLRQTPPPVAPVGGSVPMPQVGQKRPNDGSYGGFAQGQVVAGAAAGFTGGQVPGMAAADAQVPKKMRTDKQQLISKNTGTSLLETFTADQIRLHVDSLFKATEQMRLAQLQPPDACKVCGVSRLTFEPPVIYCNGCGVKIKRLQVYYCTPANNKSDIKGSWCHTCFTDQKADRILLEGSNFKRSDLEKKRNDFEADEHWVACDNCEGWVHQICGLFNKGRNTSEVPYLCPTCLLEGLETKQRQRTEVRPQAMLDARELPHNQLSLFLEQYMAGAIQEERIARAKYLQMAPHEVPGAEGLSVRVINSIVKKCETKPRFAETFSTSEGYPTEMPYRQRVIVLFQNLDGVDVCLFVMYVQEYGASCPKPNQNCVYLSYLDSVKYFRPETVMAHGCPNPNTSLRTFVYHQLQVAYLQYVKRMGFEQMYIWACPPMQGDDYILYCHPSKQKTPRSDRLRAWYHDMLKDAKARGIVKHLSTLWDTFFEGGKDHRLERCSSTHMPYLEGDYWPGEAENLLMNIEAGGSKSGKNGAAGAGAGAVARKNNSKGKRYGSGPATTDEQLMSRLGEILGGNMKEDFIVVHLKEVCTFCRAHQDSGIMYKYHSSTPLKSQAVRTFEGVKIEGGPNVPLAPIHTLALCEPCFIEEQKRYLERSSHVRLPQNVSPDKLECVEVVPDAPLVDNDPDMECEHFETRQSFLNLCQGNYYQFDTIRRAKHSSMMVLYHLHNPEAPAFTTTCNVCSSEIESASGFKCTVCPDFDMCEKCQQTTGHPHQLVKHTKRVDETRVRLTEQERRERSEQLQKTMTLLVHACSCNDPNCASSSCKKVRLLFRHAMECQTKVTGGCLMCKKMWCLLNLHAKSCTQPGCVVPRCRELKELWRRQAARQEDQRRKAYQNMLRNQMAAQQ